MNTRKSFVFSAEATTRLEKIGRACRLENASSVVRLSLLVLEDLLRALSKGHTIEIVQPDGVRRTYHPLLQQQEESAIRLAS